jgi:hypothetical protein
MGLSYGVVEFLWRFLWREGAESTRNGAFSCGFGFLADVGQDFGSFGPGFGQSFGKASCYRDNPDTGNPASLVGGCGRMILRDFARALHTFHLPRSLSFATFGTGWYTTQALFLLGYRLQHLSRLSPKEVKDEGLRIVIFC